MKIDYTGFGDKTFSGTIDSEQYEKFMTRNTLRELRDEYVLKKKGMAFNFGFDFEDNFDLFQTLFLLFQKTELCRDKYGDYDQTVIDLTKVPLTHEGDDIILPDNNLEPTDYLIE